MDLRVREVTVGSIVIVAILVFVFGTMWLSGRRVGSGNTVRMQFANVSGLKRASPLRISGVNVGKVESIRFLDVGKVLVEASLPPQIVPRVDATAEIVSVTLVGDYAVDFEPGESGERLPAGRVILGTRAVQLSDRAVELSDRADSLLLGAQAIVNQKTADQLSATLQALQATLRATQQTMRILSDTARGPMGELGRTLVAFRQLGTRLDSTLARPGLVRALDRADTLTGNLAAMTAQLTTTSARLDSVLVGVNSGRGTIGKFATDSGFYTDIRDLSQSMKRLLDELQKHPGKVPVTVKLF
jgi:phospholipid/cholesterol/gamma-HCH transport system substrate-binding protein